MEYLENKEIGETAAQREILLNKSQEAVKVKYTYNFNSLGIVNTNTDSNLYCKYSKQEYLVKLNIEKDYFEYEQN